MGFAKKKTSQCNNTVKNWYYLYWHVDLFSAMIIVLGYLVSHREKTSWLMHPLHQLQPCQKIKACVPCCRDILLHLHPVWPWRDPHKTRQTFSILLSVSVSVFIICYEQDTADTRVYRNIDLEELNLTRSQLFLHN